MPSPFYILNPTSQGDYQRVTAPPGQGATVAGIEVLLDPEHEGRIYIGGIFALYILTGGMLGFCYDLIHQQFIKVTSSMSMGIAGNAKMVLLIIISMVSETLESVVSQWSISSLKLA
mgnify:CR=1 FL=1